MTRYEKCGTNFFNEDDGESVVHKNFSLHSARLQWLLHYVTAKNSDSNEVVRAVSEILTSSSAERQKRLPKRFPWISASALAPFWHFLFPFLYKICILYNFVYPKRSRGQIIASPDFWLPRIFCVWPLRLAGAVPFYFAAKFRSPLNIIRSFAWQAPRSRPYVPCFY